jgi:hypothetical protein
MRARLPDLSKAELGAWARRLLGRTRSQEPWWAEMWAAAAAVMWGAWAWLLSEGIDGSDAFRLVIGLADPGFWYASGVFMGLLQIAALRHDHARLRWWCCVVMSWWWLFLAMAVAQADPIPRPGLSLYIIMAAINLYSLARLRWIE